MWSSGAMGVVPVLPARVGPDHLPSRRGAAHPAPNRRARMIRHNVVADMPIDGTAAGAGASGSTERAESKWQSPPKPNVKPNLRCLPHRGRVGCAHTAIPVSGRWVKPGEVSVRRSCPLNSQETAAPGEPPSRGAHPWNDPL